MSYKEIIEEARANFEKAFKFLEEELKKFRTSRANPSMIEDLQVNVLGSYFPLKQLGAISVPKPNQMIIQPWDNSYLESIEKAISQSGLGLLVSNDKNVIRVTVPSLTEEYKEQMKRLFEEKAEKVRQTIRRYRDNAWNKIQEGFREKKIREDDKFRGRDELQKVVDEYNEKIEELIEKKEKELSY